ncbi:unnamed protein product [Musa acuminata subsp. burmannicoides]
MAVTVVTENIAAQLDLLVDLRRYFRYAAIDTEFSGFIRPTPPYASEEDRYADVKYNVDRMKLIQLGITLFDENGSTPWQGCCWQFNFSDFDPLVHPSSPKSLELLRRSGHDLEETGETGSMETSGAMFCATSSLIDATAPFMSPSMASTMWPT